MKNSIICSSCGLENIPERKICKKCRNSLQQVSEPQISNHTPAPITTIAPQRTPSNQYEAVLNKCRENGKYLTAASKDYFLSMTCPYCRSHNSFRGIIFFGYDNKPKGILSAVWTWEVGSYAQCKKCHAKWDIFEVRNPQEGAPQYSVELYRQVCEVWNNSESHERDSVSFCRDLAGDLLIAIEAAKGIYPDAYGLLSFIAGMHDTKQATTYSDIAISQDKFHAQAWLVRTSVALALQDVSQNAQVDGLLAKAVLSGINTNRTGKAIQAVNILISTFRDLTILSRDPEKWLMFADTVLRIGEALFESKASGMPNVFREIVNAPWDQLPQGEYADAISNMKRKAQGRALMYK